MPVSLKMLSRLVEFKVVLKLRAQRGKYLLPAQPSHSYRNSFPLDGRGRGNLNLNSAYNQ